MKEHRRSEDRPCPPPQPGDPVYGAPDAGLSLVPREPGAKPVAEVESYDEASGEIVLRGLSPSTGETPAPGASDAER